VAGTTPTFEERVLDVVRSLAPGDVVTYGEIAAEAGSPGAGRAVGNVMAHCPDDVPWWRVVTSTGRLVPDHEAEQAERLRGEGVATRAGRVEPTVARGSAASHRP
jgi:methylated-DNA-protein-cysteine methyltransferase-like protein